MKKAYQGPTICLYFFAPIIGTALEIIIPLLKEMCNEDLIARIWKFKYIIQLEPG
ncbi:MAG: hypothetical protein QG657_577 [Acidobacteriota bacterium]|nr:hypothetical protein [Acidobacteriota bacterium]